jgi:hypothetical protein
MSAIYYHGANGDKILGIIASGTIIPNNNEIFLSRFTWESCFMHGADTKRKASFVIKVDANIPSGVRQFPIETPGVRDTIKLMTNEPIQVTVLELIARRLGEDGAELVRREGAAAIKVFLGG